MRQHPSATYKGKPKAARSNSAGIRRMDSLTQPSSTIDSDKHGVYPSPDCLFVSQRQHTPHGPRHLFFATFVCSPNVNTSPTNATLPTTHLCSRILGQEDRINCPCLRASPSDSAINAIAGKTESLLTRSLSSEAKITAGLSSGGSTPEKNGQSTRYSSGRRAVGVHLSVTES